MGFARPENLLTSLLLALLPVVAMASEWRAERLLEFGRDSCRGWETSAAPASGFGAEIVNQSDINFRENRIGTRFRLQLETMATVEFDVIDRGGRPSRFVSSLFNRFGDPLLLVARSGDQYRQPR
jgi:hypothetical protein